MGKKFTESVLGLVHPSFCPSCHSLIPAIPYRPLAIFSPSVTQQTFTEGCQVPGQPQQEIQTAVKPEGHVGAVGGQGSFTSDPRPLSSSEERPRQVMAVQRPWGERNGDRDPEMDDQLPWTIRQQDDSFGFPQGQGTAEGRQSRRWTLALVQQSLWLPLVQREGCQTPRLGTCSVVVVYFQPYYLPTIQFPEAIVQ